MLKLKVVLREEFDDSKQEFVDLETFDLELEHSLVSVSKWESNFEIPFMGKREKTNEEIFWYVKAMVLTPDVPDEVFAHLSNDNIREINKYINKKMTATTFHETSSKKGPQETITSEIIYYWMFSLNIPMECQHWHLERLLALIKVVNLKNAPPKKMSREEQASRQRELNEKRRREFNSRG